jgi:hypothetical protein
MNVDLLQRHRKSLNLKKINKFEISCFFLLEHICFSQAIGEEISRLQYTVELLAASIARSGRANLGNSYL